MSNYLSQFANDLEEIVQCCVWYLYDPICMNQPNVDILEYFINGLNIVGETDYDLSILKIRCILLERMWRLVFCEYLSFAYISYH